MADNANTPPEGGTPKEGENTQPQENKNEPVVVENQEELITLVSGDKVTVEELKQGYLRQSDYTKKTQGVAEERRKLDEALSNLVKDPEPKTEPKNKYNPEQLTELKGILTEMGYVSKDELNTMKSADVKTQITNAFFEKHPEYKEINDPGDIKYSALKNELAYYNTNDLGKLTLIMERAHEKVKGKLDAQEGAGKNLATLENQEAATVGSNSGGNASAHIIPKSDLTPAQIKVMKDVGVWDKDKHG